MIHRVQKDGLSDRKVNVVSASDKFVYHRKVEISIETQILQCNMMLMMSSDFAHFQRSSNLLLNRHFGIQKTLSREVGLFLRRIIFILGYDDWFFSESSKWRKQFRS